jgi:hydroxymethylbilane synthase
VSAVHDDEAAATTGAERALLGALGGGCHVPIGAYATASAGQLRLIAQVTSTDGRATVHADCSGPASEPQALGERVARQLCEGGAGAILSEDAAP